MLNVGIIGRGAIGSLLAAKLVQAGFKPTLFWRQSEDNSVEVKFQSGMAVNINATPASIVDVLLLPVKAYQVYDALNDYQSFVDANTSIVLLHNGAGTENKVLAQFPQNSILRMTTSIAARKINATEVLETGLGGTQAGWLRAPKVERRKKIESLFNQLLTNCEWFEDIRIPVWQKLAINAVINPLTAISNVPNGKLVEQQFAQIKVQVLREFIAVAASQGLSFEHNTLTNVVEDVISLTAKNHSSMLQDVVNHRKTEVDFINGYLVDIGRKNAIDVEANNSLLQQIHSMENLWL